LLFNVNREENISPFRRIKVRFLQKSSRTDGIQAILLCAFTRTDLDFSAAQREASTLPYTGRELSTGTAYVKVRCDLGRAWRRFDLGEVCLGFICR